jgi:[ribosomal protein S18]-alanine N-acetyltransferase
VPFVIEPMTQDDVSEVSQVERRCFNNPWPTSAYRRELRDPEHNYYIVARWRDPRTPHPAPEDRPRGGFARLPFLRRSEHAAKGPILGFAGMWLMLDEAHITTIGVAPEQRGKSLGEMLFVNLLDDALRRRARWMTLEVRVSNASALGLYAKYGFTQQGLRKRYYSDNGEDAYIMWSPPLNEPPMPQRLQELRATLGQKLTRWHHSLDGTDVVPGSGFRVPG